MRQRKYNSKDSFTRCWKGLGVKRSNGKCITVKEGIYGKRDSSEDTNGGKVKEH
jgi:hypothetical protein